MLDIDQLRERIRDINSGIEIRDAEASDAGSFIELLNSQYARKKTIDYFNWQFFAAPHPAKLFLAVDGDQIAGAYGVHIRRLSNGCAAAFIIDLIVAEKYKRRGLLYLFEESAERFAQSQNAAILTCLPNKNGMQAHLSLPGWKLLGTIPTLELEERVNSVPTPEQFVLNERVQFVGDQSYWKWRFELNPAYTYKSYRLEGGEFAVTKRFTDPVSKKTFGDVVDFHCQGADGKILASVFQNAVRSLQDEGLATITTWALPDTALHSILIAMGFKERQCERYFCMKVLDQEAKELDRLEAWHLVESDSEVY